MEKQYRNIMGYELDTTYKSKKYYVGSKHKTNGGEIAVVLGKKKSDSRRVLVGFLNSPNKDYVKFVGTGSLNYGECQSPYRKSVFGVGFLGLNPPKDKTTSKRKWESMIRRAYSSKSHIEYPTYKNVEVCKEWQNATNFDNWFKTKYIKGYHIDKDLLGDGNLYSPKSCCFLPSELNYFLEKADSIRGEYPLGVCVANSGRYVSSITIRNKKVSLGRYDTPEEAHEVYLKAKKKRAIGLANKYKDNLDKRAYKMLKEEKIEDIINLK